MRLPDRLAYYIDETRTSNRRRPNWPILWDCDGRGYARAENPSTPISPKTINAALARAAHKTGILVNVTAHVARHSYCTEWVTDQGSTEHSLERLSRQVGTSVSVLRNTYLHVDFKDADWEHIRRLGKPG